MVEFALVLPLLMIFLLGVADFGRIFTSGITEEAAARDAAEAAAVQWVQLCQQYAQPCSGGLLPADYTALHTLALGVACREAEGMSGRAVDGSGNCTMPIIAVCVHDDGSLSGGGDSKCGIEAPLPGGPCYAMDGGWSSAKGSPTDRPYVEVRICYRFDPLFTFAFAGWGSIWMQKANYFAVANY